jgi:hypothetical protein
MTMKEVLYERFDDLGITKYELTRRVLDLRGKPSEPTEIQRLQSAVTKALNEPYGRRYAAIAELVEAMGGEIVIRWKDYKEVKVP